MNENLKETINELKSEIDSLRPLDKETENRIQQKFRLDWNYHSNNIEGNSLTFGETKSFLLHGITADGKPLKDHLDIKGHNEVLLLLQDVIKDERPLTENFIREIHHTILHEPYEKNAETPEGIKTKRRINIGEYKTQPNHVKTQTGEIFYFATPEETPAKMNDLMDWYKNSIEKKSLHPTELAALFHYKFIRIHPFDDGNGRLARILMNLTLMKFGFPPVIIKTQKKDDYYRALQQADGDDENYFVDYISQLEIDSLQLYLRGAKGENIEEDTDIDKEIALFKAKILNENQKNKLRNSAILIERFNDSYKLLLESLNNKLQKFSDLFDQYSHNITIDNSTYSYNTLINILTAFEERCKTDNSFRYIQFHFNLVNLKQSDKFNSLNINVTFVFLFNEYEIRITNNNRNIVKGKFNYEKQISEEEINNMINNTVKDLINIIEQIAHS